MSSRKKRNAPPNLQETFDAIKGEYFPSLSFGQTDCTTCGCLCQDLLLRVKDVKNARSSIIDDLHQVAALAESFTEQRPKSNKGWLDMADALDREGQPTCLYRVTKPQNFKRSQPVEYGLFDSEE
jgi:hypothetical protein